MSLTSPEVSDTQYIRTGKKQLSRGTGKSVAIKAADQLSTASLIWLLVKRHKVAILALGNIILVLNWAIPAWFDIVLSLFSS